MTLERSRRFGQLLMAASIAQLVLFVVAATRRSYLAVAIPVGIALGLVSGLAFWVGYTMATTVWENPQDFGLEEDARAEGAPPPDTLG